MRRFAAPLRVLLLALLPACAGAQEGASFPSHVIRYVVASSPGGIADTSARILAPALSRAFGQPVVVENRTAGGLLATADLVAKSPADGHTLLSVTPQLAIAPSLHRQMPFDVHRDLAPVALLGFIPIVLAVNAKVPAHTVKELVELARREPGKLNYSSTGQGTAVHLAAELLKHRAGISVMHVPYRGAAAAMNGLIAGDVDLMMESMPPLLPQIRAGRLRPLAVASAQRVAALPGVPTLVESGYPGLEIGAWMAVMAPGGTPPPVIARLDAEIHKALEGGETGAALERAGVILRYMGPADFRAFLEAEIDKFALAVKVAGVVIQ